MSNKHVSCLFCRDSDFVSLRYRATSHYYNKNHLYPYYWCNFCEVLWLDRSVVVKDQQYDSEYYSFAFSYSLLDKLKILIKSFYFNLFHYFGIEFSFINEYILKRVFRRLKISKDSAVIDIGCGSGQFVAMLLGFGYSNCIGIDPFSQLCNKKNLNLKSIHINDIQEKFDFINAHHVIEHCTNPKEFIYHMNRILADNGIAVVTFPRFSSLIEYHGENSYLLQAPDHLTLFSDKCFRKLVDEGGFYIEYYEFDGTGSFQWLVVGELWSKGINVKGYNKKLLSLLSTNDLRRLTSISEEINYSNAANALYVLKKK
jgi:SAM-dependent methyltransferase